MWSSWVIYGKNCERDSTQHWTSQVPTITRQMDRQKYKSDQQISRKHAQVLVQEQPKQWDLFLPQVEFAINSIPNRTTEKSTRRFLTWQWILLIFLIPKASLPTHGPKITSSFISRSKNIEKLWLQDTSKMLTDIAEIMNLYRRRVGNGSS